MTAVMRAVARPTGSRALRAALVRGGKIVDERVVPAGEHLTIGSTERSSFVVAGLGSSFRLLEWTRNGYELHLGPGMSGRLALGGEVAEMSGSAARSPIALDDQARGKISVGDAMVLFHFVEPTVAAPRAQLPMAVRQGAFDGLDWKTTIIAAFSFLIHFGAVGTAYADFADSTIDDDGVRVARAIGVLRDLPSPPPLETKPDPDGKSADSGKTKDESRPAPGPKPGPHGNSGPPRGGPSGGSERPGDARAREIARQLEHEGAAMLLAIGGQNNGAIGRVMASGDLPMGPLDAAAGDAGGTRTGGVAGLNLGGSAGGTVRPGSGGGHGLPGVADVRGAVRAEDTGVVNGPKKPIPGTNVAPPSVDVGRLPDAPRVVAGMRALLRGCYRRELDTNPEARGTVRVTAKIGSNGEVTSAQAAASGSLSSTMSACVSRVVRGAQFGPPDGGSAMLSIPMTFIPQ